MRRLIQEYQGESGEVVIDPALKRTLASDRIYIIACGTSNHAGWAAKAILEN